MKSFAILLSLMIGSVAAMSLTGDSDGPVSRSPAVIVSGSTTQVALTLNDPDWETCFVCHEVADVVPIIVDYYNNPPTPPPSGGGTGGSAGSHDDLNWAGW